MGRKISVIFMLVLIIGMIAFIISRWHVSMQMVGDEEITVPYGTAFEDPGAVAELEGPVFDHEVDVRTQGQVDTNEVGTYKVKYRASTGMFGAQAERTVHVEDVTAPMLVLEDRPVDIMIGDAWADGYSAMDDHDGDLTDQVKIEGEVDITRAGAYTLVYTVSDAAGNEARAERTVTVTDEVKPVEGSKIVFLTFDDGPSEHTERLLDILAAHNAKATFFCISPSDAYHSVIKREYEEGHTVAVHSLTHDYNKIYSSQEAYWADFEAMNDIIEEQTGHRANIFRFPGGSSNTVSNFNPGVMTRLAQDAADRGLQYFDWNVESGDAGRVDTADGVYNNIVDGVASLNNQGYSYMVVLCHDSHGYTVDAMDRVLTWFEENGYTLLPLQKGICECHHGIAN